MRTSVICSLAAGTGLIAVLAVGWMRAKSGPDSAAAQHEQGAGAISGSPPANQIAALGELRVSGIRPSPEQIAADQAAALRAEASRAASILATKEAIAAECERYAQSDWNRWNEQVVPYREALKKRIAATKPLNPNAQGFYEARSAVLEAIDPFWLFEPRPEFYLKYTNEPETVDAFRTEQPVIAASRWLKQRGIDVIFIPVPKMTEVHPERFAEHCPEGQIIAPHIRRLVLDLLEADVEVLDLLPTFLAQKYDQDEPLYHPADPHWGPRGQRVAAGLIGARLRRYAFVARALSEPPMCETVEGPYAPLIHSAAYPALNKDQRRRAAERHPKTTLISRNCSRQQISESSPVAFIGDSYNDGLIEMVGREINMPINMQTGGSNTTHAFKNFLRNPDILKDCKVLVWVVCHTSLQAPWPLPPDIREAGRSTAGK